MKGPVVVLGPPGAGKSTAGRAAAARLGMAFVDVDEVIGDAEAIFRDEGEASFRVRELQALHAALDGRDVVIAAGAGIVDTAPARALLAERALCVLLDVDGGVAVPRLLASSPRPWLPAHGDPHVTWRKREEGRARHRDALVARRVIGHGTVDEVTHALAAAIHDLRPIPVVSPAARVIDDVKSSIDEAASREGVFVVVEERVARLHRLRGHVVVEGGEGIKQLARVEQLARELVAAGMKKGHEIVAVGGGALLDAVGLCAALLFRGVPWTAVPTTLLAQADAGLGGKTAVDLDGKKNLLGAFHAPKETWLGAAFLASLDDAQLRAGRAEILKHELLAADAPNDGAARGPWIDDVVRSLGVKTSVVRRDPLERGLRAVLNLGHTTAHALEATTAISHGDAVLHGLRVMLRLSVLEAGLDPDVAARIDARVVALGAPAVPVGHARVLDALSVDKKAGRWVLLRAPGLPVVRAPSRAHIEESLKVLER